MDADNMVRRKMRWGALIARMVLVSLQTRSSPKEGSVGGVGECCRGEEKEDRLTTKKVD